MNSIPDQTYTPLQRTAQRRWLLPAATEATEQENARLQLALRELRHRCCNQWQFLLGLEELERMQPPQTTSMGCSVRLHAMMHAFAMLNRMLDTDTEALTSDQTIEVRPALTSLLTLLQATMKEDALAFELQDAGLAEKGCAALMLICAELVCNAAKYGRKITQVTFHVQGEQGILEVRDDGPGFLEGFRVEKQTRQGLQLVEALCRCDLNGEMRCHNNPQGGIVTLNFPIVPAPGIVAEETEISAFCAMEGIICSPDITKRRGYLL